MSTLLKAAPVAESVYTGVSSAAEALKKKTGHIPTLATLLVGDDPASQIYVKKKGEMCIKLGMGYKDFKLETSTTQSALIDLVKKLNVDPAIDGILVQRPLPKQIDESRIFDLIDPSKDVDCFSPHNVGMLSQGRATLLPCTPAGMMRILSYYKIDPSGKRALVLGRSDIVGKPMAMLLLQAHATVTIAHSKTQNLEELVAQSDIIVAAIGKLNFLDGKIKWKSSAVVLDVGINRDAHGKIHGDVYFDEVAPKVAAITPVPGGVGPMTIAILMENTVKAAYSRNGMHWNG
jgi:methylenetetrahydrofolate dehydrogenase (NADP+)/methenyltetrahydrofolate cyclohydrolase